MIPAGADSITRWIACLKGGDADAARLLAERYWQRLEVLARGILGRAPRRLSDEEDVVISVLASLCRGAAKGNFTELSSREDLWWLLIAITKQKSVDHIRRESAQKRGGFVSLVYDTPNGADSTLSFRLDDIVSDEPTPEFLVTLQDQHQRLLALLRDETLREIADCRLEGCTVQEIAERLGISTRAVERKLALIRKKWERELQS